MREIPREVAEEQGVPEDLDSGMVGPYTVPSTTRRRRAAVVYLVGAAGAGALAATVLPAAFWGVAAALLLIAAYHLVAGWPIAVSDAEALDAANRTVEFPVGHASAAVGFDGWRARPVWNVLVFSADDPPSRRGLVRVDARSGTVVESYVEDVPSDG